MSRSLKKGPFIDEHLMKKAVALNVTAFFVSYRFIYCYAESKPHYNGSISPL